MLAIREQLTVNKCPAGDRYVACSPDIVTRLLSIPNFVVASSRGDGGTALANATVGTIYGLTFVESSAIDPGSAIAYHRSGFAFGSAAPKNPGGGADSSSASAGGVRSGTCWRSTPATWPRRRSSRRSPARPRSSSRAASRSGPSRSG